MTFNSTMQVLGAAKLVAATRPSAEAASVPAMAEQVRPRVGGPLLLGVVSTVAFTVGMAAFSVLVPLSEAAIAPGVIKAEGNRRTVAHLEGGIVRDILVRDGDRVTAGQPLMRLEDVQAVSSQESLRAQRWSLLAQDGRIQAEVERLAEPQFADALLASLDPRAREAINGQMVLFASRQASLRSQMEIQYARILQFEALSTSAKAQIESNRRQLRSLQREEADVAGLLRQGLERMPRLLALQRQVAATQGTVGDLTAQVERAEAQVSEAQSEVRRAMNQRRQEASTEGQDVRSKLADVEERLRAATDVSARRDILAPEDGTVLNTRFFNPGAVVRAGEAVMDIVPVKDRLIAEVKVAATDIDVVHPGLHAEVRLPAFKQRLVPFLSGSVTVVAGDVTQDPRTMHEFYQVRVVIDDDQLARLEGVELRAGMPVEAQIQVGERSLMRYMLQPLIDSFHRAFREQ